MRHLLCLCAVISACVLPARAFTIDTTATWDGTTTIGDFGKSGFSGMGQTFKVPVGNPKLDSFTFFLQPNIAMNQQVLYHLHIIPFRESSAPFIVTGPIVWSSDQRVMNPPAAPLVPVTFNPGANLVAGDTYIALLFADNYNTATLDSRLRIGWNSGNVYNDGIMRLTQPYNGSLQDLMNSAGWGSAGGDLAFIAQFSTPEPGMLGLLLVGGIAFLRRQQ